MSTRVSPLLAIGTAAILAGICASAFGASAPAASVRRQGSDVDFGTIGQRLQARLDDTGVASIAVAIVRDGRIIWEQGFGWADREHGIRATPNTIYGLASVSKPLTTTGLLLLARRGQLDLSRPANQYLDQHRIGAWIGDPNAATIELIAEHRSGLPRYYDEFWLDEPYSPISLDSKIDRHARLVALPGERFEYSNVGYDVLAKIVARVSGSEFAVFMQRNVFTPLGMMHTSVGVRPELKRFQAVKYDDTGVPIHVHDSGAFSPGSGGMYSSAHDLARYALFQLEGRGPDSLLPRGVSLAEGAKAIGWSDSSARPGGLRVIAKAGGMPGIATYLLLVPERRLGLVVLANCSWFGDPARVISPKEVADDLLEVLLSDRAAGPREHVETSEPAAIEPSLTGLWQGSLSNHEGSLPAQLEVSADGNARLKLGQQPWSALRGSRSKDGWFAAEGNAEVFGNEANRRRPYSLELSLKKRNDRLNGSVLVETYVRGRSRQRLDELTFWLDLVAFPRPAHAKTDPSPMP